MVELAMKKEQTAKEIANELWAKYLASRGDTVVEATAAYKAYVDGLAANNIIPTPSGYKFRSTI
jgi:hypothetical protein